MAPLSGPKKRRGTDEEVAEGDKGPAEVCRHSRDDIDEDLAQEAEEDVDEPRPCGTNTSPVSTLSPASAWPLPSRSRGGGGVLSS